MLRSTLLLSALSVLLATGCGAAPSTSSVSTEEPPDDAARAAIAATTGVRFVMTTEESASTSAAMRPRWFADGDRVFVSRPGLDGVTFGLLGHAPVYRGSARSLGVRSVAFDGGRAMLAVDALAPAADTVTRDGKSGEGPSSSQAIVKLDLATGTSTSVVSDFRLIPGTSSLAIDRTGATYFVAAPDGERAANVGDLQRVDERGNVRLLAKSFLETFEAQDCEAMDLLVDETSVYGLQGCGAQSLIVRAPKAGDVRHVLAAEGQFVGGAALTDTSIVFASAGGIRKLTKAGGPVTTLVPLADGVVRRRLAVFGSDVWFHTDSPSPRIMKVPVDGGPAAVVTDLPADPYGQTPKVDAMFSTKDAVYLVVTDMDSGDKQRATLFKVTPAQP